MNSSILKVFLFVCFLQYLQSFLHKIISPMNTDNLLLPFICRFYKISFFLSNNSGQNFQYYIEQVVRKSCFLAYSLPQRKSCKSFTVEHSIHCVFLVYGFYHVQVVFLLFLYYMFFIMKVCEFYQMLFCIN